MMHSCIVYTERAEMPAVSRGTGHVTTKQRCKCTTLADIHSFENHMRQERSESPRERRTARYIKEIVHHSITGTHLLSPSTIQHRDTFMVTVHSLNTVTHLSLLSQHSDTLIDTAHYSSSATHVSSPSTITYRHRKLHQHSDTVIVTVHYPNTATHLSSLSTIKKIPTHISSSYSITYRNRPLSQHSDTLTVTGHYVNIATHRHCPLSTIPTQRPLSQHSDTLTATAHYPNTATHLPSLSTIPTQ